MAAPPEVTIDNLSGRYTQNKRLSDDLNPLLELQGVSWLARKALALAPASFAMKQYQDENKKTHLETTISVATMTQSNDRVLDWVPIVDKDAPLGPIEVQVRIIDDFEALSPIDDESRRFLEGEVLKDGSPSSWDLDGCTRHIQTFDKSVGKNAQQSWTMQQTWGFEEINGSRYHTRRAVIQRGDEVRRARLVYEYTSI